MSSPEGICFFLEDSIAQRDHDYFVYLLASRSRQLYVGMTNSLQVRFAQHLEAPAGSYTARYNINRLVYFEHTQYVLNAIAREKELKGWTRAQRVELIESINPTWEDLSLDWGESLRRFWRGQHRGIRESEDGKQIPFGDDKDKGG